MSVRKFASIGLIFMLLVVSAFAADTVVVKVGYWLRSQPCTSQNLSNCPDGIRVTREPRPAEVVQRSGDWALVRMDGRRYWVYSQGLEINRVSENPSHQGVQVGQTYNPIHDNTAVRNKPGTQTPGSAITGSVDRSTSLEVVGVERDGQGDTWYRVHYHSGGTAHVAYIFEGRVRPEDDGQTEAGDCPDGNCPGQGNLNAADTRRVAQVTANDGRGYRLPSGYGRSCSNFINSSGLGDWGVKMVDAAKRVAPNCFYDRGLFNSLCPNYLSLNESQKNAFIALVFASIANTESGCNPRARARGSNDIADGLFQLEYSASFRQRAGRNRQWCKAGTPTNSQAIGFQAECSVSIVEDTICGNGRSITSGDGYWQKLRGNGRIARNIRNTAVQWGLCR